MSTSGSVLRRRGCVSARRRKICPVFGCAQSMLRPSVYLVWLAGNRPRRPPLSPRRTTPRLPQKPHHIPGGRGQSAPTPSSRADPSHTGLGFAHRPMRFRASD